MLHFLFLITFLSTFSHDAVARDFCVGDLKGPDSPLGYPCKSLENIVVDDFTSSVLNLSGSSENNFTKTSLTAAFVSQFPGLNGLSMGIAHAITGPGGFFPMHNHPDATEVIYVINGSAIVGFISSANTPFVKTLNKGDLMILPQGLLHFIVNALDDQPAEGIFMFNSENPSTQFLDNSLFGNDLDSAILEKTTSLGADEIKRLKGIFGKKE